MTIFIALNFKSVAPQKYRYGEIAETEKIIKKNLQRQKDIKKWIRKWNTNFTVVEFYSHGTDRYCIPVCVYKSRNHRIRNNDFTGAFNETESKWHDNDYDNDDTTTNRKISVHGLRCKMRLNHTCNVSHSHCSSSFFSLVLFCRIHVLLYAATMKTTRTECQRTQHSTPHGCQIPFTFNAMNANNWGNNRKLTQTKNKNTKLNQIYWMVEAFFGSNAIQRPLYHFSVLVSVCLV